MKQSKILVPVDFSENSRKALDYAAFLAGPLKGSLELLFVWQPPAYVVPDMMLAVPGWSPASLEEYARTEAVKDFEKFTTGFNKGDLNVKTRIDVGRPATAILRTAAEGFDLIVMGTHGRTGMGRLLLGSVAQEVAAKAPCPVVTLKLHEPKVDG